MRRRRIERPVVRRHVVRRLAVATSTMASVVMLWPPGAAAAQEAPAITAVDSSGHPAVTLVVEPPEAFAGFDLPATAFSVTENGEARHVTVQRAGATQLSALEVVLVVDTSGSMNGAPLDEARAAAAAFLGALPEGTRVALVSFGDVPVVVTPLTTDVGAVAGALTNLAANGETALYDAVTLGSAQFSGTEGARRALVVLSDGGDTASTATLEATMGTLNGATFDFTAVALVTPEYDGAALDQLAATAGGRVLSADQPDQLTAVYGTVAADLLNRYAVTYTSAAGGVTQVALTVTFDGITASTDREIRLPGTGTVAGSGVTERVGADPGWLASRQALYLGAGLIFTVFAGALAWTFLRTRETQVRLSDRFGFQRSRGPLPAITRWADRATEAAEHHLKRSGRETALYESLERAGIALRPGEFVVLACVTSLAAFALGVLISGFLLGLVFAATPAAGAPLVLHILGSRTRKMFGEQLADTLQLITGNLRAGHSILQSIDSVAADSPSPTKEEFERLVVEIRLGRDLPDALRALHARIGNQDFEWFVQALQIHREVGGDLAEILDTVANTIRERTRLHRHVQALSAEGRLSAVILYVLPFAVGLLFMLINREYMSELFTSTLGKGMLVVAAGFMTAGFFWLRKVIRIEF